MRIWDLNPGYLNRSSLLGEHREMHGTVAVLVHNKKGYSKHPETLRWKGYGWALRMRHHQIKAEMELRGYNDNTPVRTRSNPGKWSTTYIDTPREQLRILAGKYKDKDKEPGRIPLPKNGQELWAHHKYSVMARSVRLYKAIGKETAALRKGSEFAAIAQRITEQLREAPSNGGMRNALEHMWGHVSDFAPEQKRNVASWTSKRLLSEIQILATTHDAPYLQQSTALSELKVWLP